VQPAIAPTVTALSIMLAAYGFFYNALKGRIEAGADVGIRAGDPVVVARQSETVSRARNTAALLGFVPLLIWLLFLKEVVNEIEAAFAVGFSLDHYSALDIAFVLIANSWLLIAWVCFAQARKLHQKQKDYESS
jgi:hypothetical protein